MTLTLTLSDHLLPALQKADEVYIAVALMKLEGCELLFKSIPGNCLIQTVLGIDLPTDPDAMRLLLARNVRTSIYKSSETFHPKVYLVKSSGLWRAFVGSANCTDGGLTRNIEMGVEITDQSTCEELKSWFDGLLSTSTVLTEEYIKQYQPVYDRRVGRRTQDIQDVEQTKLFLDQYVREVSSTSPRTENDQPTISVIEREVIKHDPVEGLRLLQKAINAGRVFWGDTKDFPVKNVYVTHCRKQNGKVISPLQRSSELKSPEAVQQEQDRLNGENVQWEYKFMPSKPNEGHVNIEKFDGHRIKMVFTNRHHMPVDGEAKITLEED